MFTSSDFSNVKIVALAGGVGGAKLAAGLAKILPAGNLTIIVNVGDDFEHYGLYICPDLDTVCYTLAGIDNPATGWGRAGESWHALETIGALGGLTWFRLGDHDLGLHLERSRRRQLGQPLSQITRQFCKAFGIQVQVLPATDNPVPTWVDTDEGELPFQEYFVRRQSQPRVEGFNLKNVEHAIPAPGVIDAIYGAELVIICPSNPWLSIDPILAVPGISSALHARTVVAVSPLIGGRAIKGPAAKISVELGIEPSAISIARHYVGLISGFVLDSLDVDQIGDIRSLGIQCLASDIYMKTLHDRVRLAEEVVEFGLKLIQGKTTG